jgi:hypothetical protein
MSDTAVLKTLLPRAEKAQPGKGVTVTLNLKLTPWPSQCGKRPARVCSVGARTSGYSLTPQCLPTEAATPRTWAYRPLPTGCGPHQFSFRYCRIGHNSVSEAQSSVRRRSAQKGPNTTSVHLTSVNKLENLFHSAEATVLERVKDRSTFRNGESR